MRKKSFWIRLNPWNPLRRRTFRPVPSRGVPRPPRHVPCTRRPASSEAPGEIGELEPGRAPCRRQRQVRRPGLSPWRRSPFSSNFRSSSSFASRGLPRSFRLLLFPPRGSVPGPVSPGRCSGPSIGFKSVKIVLHPNSRSGSALAAVVHSVRLAFPSASPSPRFRLVPTWLPASSVRLAVTFASARSRLSFGQRFDAAV